MNFIKLQEIYLQNTNSQYVTGISTKAYPIKINAVDMSTVNAGIIAIIAITLDKANDKATLYKHNKRVKRSIINVKIRAIRVIASGIVRGAESIPSSIAIVGIDCFFSENSIKTFFATYFGFPNFRSAISSLSASLKYSS